MSYPWGYWAKIAIFGIGSNSFDVTTDCLNGNQFLKTKIVNRTFEENSTIPDFCLSLNISNSLTQCGGFSTWPAYRCQPWLCLFVEL